MATLNFPSCRDSQFVLLIHLGLTIRGNSTQDRLPRTREMPANTVSSDSNPPSSLTFFLHSTSVLAPFEPRLAPLQERRDAFLVILGQARKREMVDVHVAGEIVERVRQAMDRQRGHDDRQRLLCCDFCG